MPKYLVCALLVLVVPAAAGCGGDDAPSRDEYVADLNKICKSTNAKIRKVKQPRTIRSIGDFARETRPIVQASIEQAEDLELPDEQGDAFKAYVKDSKASLRESDNLAKAADTGDTKAVRAVLDRTVKENRKRAAQASKLGLTSCGTG